MPRSSVDNNFLIPSMDHLCDQYGVFSIIEGNIGVGKSVLSKSLATIRAELSGRRCEAFPEPVDKPVFRSLLDKYYKDPGRWGFTFQMFVLKERFRQHTLAAELVVNGVDVIQDRSIYADGCFGRLVCNDGNMGEEEWNIYVDTFGNLKRYLRYPDVMVYLRADPEVCAARIQRRARSEEEGIPLDYLKRLHDEHEELAESMSRFTRVLVFDWNEFSTTPQQVSDEIDKAMGDGIRFMRNFTRL